MATNQTPAPPVRTILRGVLAFLPFIAIPFGILLSESALQLQVLRNDYMKSQLTQHIRLLEDEIRVLRVQKEDLEAMRRLDVLAPKLRLIPRAHGQRTVVPPPVADPEASENSALAKASAESFPEHSSDPEQRE